MSETTRIDEFHIHEKILRDRPRVTAYYDAIMNNKHLFENKVGNGRIFLINRKMILF